MLGVALVGVARYKKWLDVGIVTVTKRGGGGEWRATSQGLSLPLIC